MSHISKITKVEELTLKQLISLKRFILGKEVIGNACPHCTEFVREYTKYCSNCGQRLYWCKHYVIERKDYYAEMYNKQIHR